MDATGDATVARAPDTRTRHARWHRVARVAAVVVIGLLGGWLGLLVGGRSHTPLGPLNVTMSLRPTIVGDTTVEIPPLGTIAIDSHDGPLGLTIDVDAIDAERARTIFQDPRTLDALTVSIPEEIESGIAVLVVRAAVASVLGALLLGFLALRPRRTSLLAGGVALGVLAASGGSAWATLNVNAVQQPHYSGLLSNAPALLGDAKTIAANIEDYRKGLASLVANVSKLYDVTSTLPAYQPSADVTRVLHISDLHDNPTSWSVIASVIDQFDVDVVVDTGDIVHQGTALENRYVDSIATLGVPYVWVRGNHDSPVTQAAVAAQPNAIVLDNSFATVAGLRFVGVGDPRFTPDKSINDRGSEAEELAGRRMADELRATDTPETAEPVDIAVMHNPAGAKEFDGLVPYIFCGHMHTRDQEVLPGGSLFFQQGSTGGAGINALKGEEPTSVTLTVLYFDSQDQMLQAWDNITLGGLGLTSATIERHVAASFAGSSELDGSAQAPATSPTQTQAPTPAWTTAPATTPTTPTPTTS